jgi:hypothetical protein
MADHQFLVTISQLLITPPKGSSKKHGGRKKRESTAGRQLLNIFCCFRAVRHGESSTEGGKYPL